MDSILSDAIAAAGMVLDARLREMVDKKVQGFLRSDELAKIIEAKIEAALVAQMAEIQAKWFN